MSLERSPSVASRGSGHGVSAFITSVREKIDSSLRDLVPADDLSVAHLDFPRGGNVGDFALWLGAARYLGEKHQRVTYLCDRHRYSLSQLNSRVRSGVIFLNGGGNLGDLYPPAQRLRESVIAGFPTHKIVQLPNEIHFASRKNLERAKRVFSEHPDLTLLLRDRTSFEFAQREFDCESRLCPDMAMWLGPISAGPVARDLLWLARRDFEARADRQPGHDVETVDWSAIPMPKTQWRLRYNAARLLALAAGLSAARTGVPHSVTFLYANLVTRRLRAGCDLLGSARVVITDRLHGHILSLLLGRPHVLLDNQHGKLSNYYDTWTHESSLTHRAQSPAEALEIARSLVR